MQMTMLHFDSRSEMIHGWGGGYVAVLYQEVLVASPNLRHLKKAVAYRIKLKSPITHRLNIILNFRGESHSPMRSRFHPPANEKSGLKQ
jgi:hypothetical protein